MVAILLAYIWRFHDLTPSLSSLRIAAICTVGSWLFLVLQPRLPVLRRAVRLPYVALFLAFSIWGGVTVYFALSPEVAWEQWFSGHLKTVTMVLFVISCFTSFRLVRMAILAQVLGGAVLAFFYIKGGFSQWHFPVPMYDRNDTALVLNVALPMALFCVFTARTSVTKLAYTAVVLAIATSVMMSQSRGGFLTIAVTTAFTVVSVKKIKLRYRLLPLVLMVLGLLALPADVQNRLETIVNPTEDYNFTSDTGRIEIWKRGVKYTNEHRMFGLGWMNFPVAEATISERARLGRGSLVSVHNSFLQVAAETGIPGFLLWFSMIVASVVRLVRLRMRFSKIPAAGPVRDFVLCADFLLVSILGFCVGGQFLTMAYYPILFGQIALVAGLELTSSRWLRQAMLRTPGAHISTQ